MAGETDNQQHRTATMNPSGRTSVEGTRAMVIGVIAVLCGLALAALCATIAALVAAALGGDGLVVMQISGGTFAACLTVEIAAAALHAGLRRPPSQ